MITGLRPLRVLVSLAVLLPTIFIGVTSWRSLRRHFADAEDRLSRTLSVVHEHTVKVFETQELVAVQVDTLLDGLTDEEVQSCERALNTRLKTLIAALKAHRRAHARAVVATPVPARRLPDPSQRLGRSKPIGLRTWMMQTGLWLPRAERMRQWSSHVLIPPQNDDPVAQKLRENHKC